MVRYWWSFLVSSPTDTYFWKGLPWNTLCKAPATRSKSPVEYVSVNTGYATHCRWPTTHSVITGEGRKKLSRPQLWKSKNGTCYFDALEATESDKYNTKWILHKHTLSNKCFTIIGEISWVRFTDLQQEQSPGWLAVAVVCTQAYEGMLRSAVSALHSCLLPVVCSCLSVHRSGVTRAPSPHTMAWPETTAAKNIIYNNYFSKSIQDKDNFSCFSLTFTDTMRGSPNWLLLNKAVKCTLDQLTFCANLGATAAVTSLLTQHTKREVGVTKRHEGTGLRGWKSPVSSTEGLFCASTYTRPTSWHCSPRTNVSQKSESKVCHMRSNTATPC